MNDRVAAINTKDKKHSRPNVLFVMADEWRAQAFGYAGDANAHTPAIDLFSRESIDFQNAVAGASVCGPSRASLVTGQYPLTHGVYINDVPLKPKKITLGEAFANAGYKTGYIGKWHLHGSPEGRYERKLSPIPKAKRFGFEYWKVCECTHNYNHSIYYDGDDPEPKVWEGYDAIAQTKDACRFVEEHSNNDTPYFLVLSWGPPHFPLSGAPPRYQAMFANRDIRLRDNVPTADRDHAIADLRGYYAHGAALDDCFKMLLDTLERTKSVDNTIVVFTSDHGDMLYSQGLEHKLYPWEESICVPFLLRYPHKFGRQERRTPALLNTPDIMPTLLGLSGLSVPDGLQGKDFSASFLDVSTDPLHDSAFLSLPVPIFNARWDGIAEYRGVRTQRYTYVRSLHGPWLLYDNATDPYQKNNLCHDPAMKEIRIQLDDALNGWLHKLDDEFLPAAVYLRRDGLENFIETRVPAGKVASPWDDWKSTANTPEPQGYSIDTSISSLLDNPAAREILLQIIPDLVTSPPQFSRWQSLSLRIAQLFYPARISQTDLRELDDALSKLHGIANA